ncbi:hypothetical protein BH23GEM6_BH23GEM6_24560 [soil metagenome]
MFAPLPTAGSRDTVRAAQVDAVVACVWPPKHPGMTVLNDLFLDNRAWASEMVGEDPHFSVGWLFSRYRSIGGLVAPTAGCPRTRSWVCVLVRCSCIGTSSEWWSMRSTRWMFVA